MYDARSTAQPSGDRTEDQRHEGQQGADGHDGGGGIRGLGGDLLRPIDCLMVLILHLRDLLLRLIQRDAPCGCPFAKPADIAIPFASIESTAPGRYSSVAVGTPLAIRLQSSSADRLWAEPS